MHHAVITFEINTILIIKQDKKNLHLSFGLSVCLCVYVLDYLPAFH